MINKRHVINSGDRFGRLTVEELSPIKTSSHIHYRCLCDCGKRTDVDKYYLLKGSTTSCGCYRTEMNHTFHLIHGLSDTKEYGAWTGAKKRCFNPADKRSKHYMGRGITMCEEWKKDFSAFIRDMGPCPEGKSLDRINNDGNYEPGNCRWATNIEQMNNRGARMTHRLTYQGKTLGLTEWERELGLPFGTVRKRIHRKWSIERTLETPVVPPRKRHITPLSR